MFDTVETILNSLDVLAGMLSSMQVMEPKSGNLQRMIFELNRTGRLFSAKKDLPFREAHEIMGNWF